MDISSSTSNAAIAYPSDTDVRALARFAEQHGGELRKRTKIGGLDRLDPHQLPTNEFRLLFKYPMDITNISPEAREHLQTVTAKQWSGGGLPLPEGFFLVLLNPHQTPERKNITIMEEVAHSYFQHQPTKFIATEEGLVQRVYEKRNEDEAYWTAAAALLPSKAVALAVYRQRRAEEIGAYYGVSVELVHFRIKTWNLWEEYTTYDADARSNN